MQATIASGAQQRTEWQAIHASLGSQQRTAQQAATANGARRRVEQRATRVSFKASSGSAMQAAVRGGHTAAVRALLGARHAGPEGVQALLLAAASGRTGTLLAAVTLSTRGCSPMRPGVQLPVRVSRLQPHAPQV